MKNDFVLSALKGFDTIGLAELDDSLFKNRYDTKYLFPGDLLGPILGKLADTYRVLKIGSRYIQDYESLYFDNKEFKFYLDHQNGKLNRHKVRFRKYRDSGLDFIEVKFKNNKRQTSKWRKEISRARYLGGVLLEQDTRFISSFFRVSPGPLLPRFTVAYSRLALVHKDEQERLTIDLDLSYKKENVEKKIKNLSIAEVKQESLRQDSDFFKLMHGLRITPMRFSKYCFGIYQFFPFLKHNRFKPRYLALERRIDTHLWREIGEERCLN